MSEKRGLVILLIALLLLINLINVAVMYTAKLPFTQHITGKASNSFGDVDICVARPPTIDAIPDQAGTADTAFTYQVGATFYGSNTSTTFFDNTTFFTINGSGYISFTPTADQVGTEHILITAQDTSGCLGLNSTDDFILTIAAAAGGAGGGAAATGGGGGGGGGAAAVPRMAEKVPKPSFLVSEKLIKATVKESQRAEKHLLIKNTGDVTIDMSIFNNVSYLALTPESFTVPVEGEQEILLAFNPWQDAVPEIYSGKLTFVGTYQDIEISKTVPVIIEVESERVLFDASLDLERNLYHPGEILGATITIFGIFPGEAQAVYGISNLDGKVIYTEEEVISVQQQVSFAKQILLPETTAPGEYVLSLKIIHEESFASATELFVVEAPPSALAGLAAPLSQRPYFVLSIPLILLLMLMLFLVVYVIHRRTKKIPDALKKVERAAQQKSQPDSAVRGKSDIHRKISILKEGYNQGYIKEESYRKARTYLEQKLKGT